LLLCCLCLCVPQPFGPVGRLYCPVYVNKIYIPTLSAVHFRLILTLSCHHSLPILALSPLHPHSLFFSPSPFSPLHPSHIPTYLYLTPTPSLPYLFFISLHHLNYILTSIHFIPSLSPFHPSLSPLHHCFIPSPSLPSLHQITPLSLLHPRLVPTPPPPYPQYITSWSQPSPPYLSRLVPAPSPPPPMYMLYIERPGLYLMYSTLEGFSFPQAEEYV
jgi:hypothetical protein